MAQMVFEWVGSQIGSWIGSNVANGAFQAAFKAAGSALGSYVGGRVDQQLFGQAYVQEGPRLSEARIMSSAEGSPIIKLWGRQRLGGQLIWATRYLETITEDTQGGGKGGGGGAEVTTRTYNYSCSFAVALCEGPAANYGRIWADGMLLDQSKATIRFYPGDDLQEPDTLILAKEGTAPAYRGTCYMVFDSLALSQFGNRLPQITVEIFKPLQSDDPNMLENRVSAVTLIPASGEFAYGTDVHVKTYRGATAAENSHNGNGVANIIKALDQLDTGLPNVDAVALVSAWFGDDLRCGTCTIRPKVETDEPKAVSPRDWRVSGLVRSTAETISLLPDDSVAYGGTPSDHTIFDAIEELHARGKSVVFYPFLLMDIEQGNTLANPYSNGAAGVGQDAYPWRGRITCSPAAGFTGTVDKTGTAATQVGAFFGACDAGDFAWNDSVRSVNYSGPAEWTYRRMVLHYAELCRAVNAANPGAVDAFIIGSELVHLTTVRSSSTAYPAVQELIDLAAECRTILGGSVLIGYAADWSEYHSHRPDDGSGDVFFHLDPLWADDEIDFIGIDNYMPLADWRDGSTHLDASEGGPYDRDYLQSNIEGGEYYDWYYADDAARDAQTRSAITDGSGKPWVFRNKDIKNWWLNDHYDRPGGVESGTPTDWEPESKPIWFTELGCPAVDKGANQPNVFVDPKSSESELPHYSSGARDDLAQRRFIEALLGYWDPDEGNNPASGEYAGRMIDTTRCFVWTWDARPYPEYPLRSDVWGDAANWRLGHWVSGRVGVAPLAALVREICALVGLGDGDINVLDISQSEALVVGFATSGMSTPRDMLAVLMETYLFDAVESDGKIKFVRRGAEPVMTIDAGDYTITDQGTPQVTLTRAQEVELPRSVVVRFLDEETDYQQAAVPARRLTGGARSEPVFFDSPLVLTSSYARALGETKLYETFIGRETGEIELPPSLLRLEPSDSVMVPLNGRSYEMRIVKCDTGLSRRLGIAQTDATIYTAPELAGRVGSGTEVTIYGPPEIRFMDLPMLASDVTPHQPYVAAFATPWPGAVNVYRDVGGTFEIITTVSAPATVGETAWDLYAGPVNRWDEGNYIAVIVYGPNTLNSVTEEELLAGANTIAIENEDGEWEVLQFKTATLNAPNEYIIRDFLRGQLGTEGAMRNPVAAGARWALLDRGRLRQLNIAQTDRGNAMTLRYGPATAFHDASSYTEIENTFNAVGLRPFSPCHVKCRRDSAGDWHITWLRRARTGGDDWETTEVPLTYPDLDRYDIEILDGPGGDVVRTISGVDGVTADGYSATYEYTVAMQTADFGSPPLNVIARIYQLSDVVGRGSPWEGYVFPTIYGD